MSAKGGGGADIPLSAKKFFGVGINYLEFYEEKIIFVYKKKITFCSLCQLMTWGGGGG